MSKGDNMREEFSKPQAALEDMKRASLLKKPLVAEEALLAAVVLIEQMAEEIEKLKGQKS